MKKILRPLALIATTAALLAGCGGPPVCAAIPSCESNEKQGAACQSNETGCRTVTVCDSTIYCRPGAADGG